MNAQKHRQDHMVQQYQHAFLLTLVGGQKHANPHREAVPHKDSSPTQRQHNTTYIYPTVTNFHSDNNAELTTHIHRERSISVDVKGKRGEPCRLQGTHCLFPSKVKKRPHFSPCRSIDRWILIKRWIFCISIDKHVWW